MKRPLLRLACSAILLLPQAFASTVTPFTTPPQPEGETYTGVPYRYVVKLGQTDSATYDAVVGAWSWNEDTSGFGWTHTSLWTEIDLPKPANLTVTLTRKANVPWPGPTPGRVGGTNAMFPSFTLFKNWDIDAAPAGTAAVHQYNSTGNVAWAEDLAYMAHVDNSTEASVTRTYALRAGKYTIVQGSNAVTNDAAVRQGYQADFSTTPYSPPTDVKNDAYFTSNHKNPLVVPAISGVTANDVGVAAGFTLKVGNRPKLGGLTTAADGSFTYVPGPYFGEVGLDSFTYTLVPTDTTQETLGPATVSLSTFGSAAGQYTGHLVEGDEVAAQGLLKVALTANGKYTGTAWLLGKRYNLSGTVSTDGSTVVKAKPALPGLTLSLGVGQTGLREVTATVPNVPADFIGEAEQSPFSRFFTAPMAGVHKLTLTPEVAEGLPTGAASATLRVGPNGGATLVGKLSDKTPFSVQSGTIVGSAAGPTIPVYAPIYKKGLGTISGNLSFGAAADSSAAGVLEVFKPEPGFTMDYTAGPVETATK